MRLRWIAQALGRDSGYPGGMMPLCLHDRKVIEAFLRRDETLRFYELGDLDDFFWPYTTWYAWESRQQIEQLALLYSGTAVPTLLAFCRARDPAMVALLERVAHLLPARCDAHLSLGLAAALAKQFHSESRGSFRKMVLQEVERLRGIETSGAEALGPPQQAEIEALLQQAYPHHWFEPRMLQTGHYVGIRQAGRLVCVAGVHVYSPRYRTAALGNVATHPDARGQGLARQACAQLCRQLLGTVDTIGLNVAHDNGPAVRCYEQLGFATVATYEECQLRYLDAE